MRVEHPIFYVAKYMELGIQTLAFSLYESELYPSPFFEGIGRCVLQDLCRLVFALAYCAFHVATWVLVIPRSVFRRYSWFIFVLSSASSLLASTSSCVEMVQRLLLFHSGTNLLSSCLRSHSAWMDRKGSLERAAMGSKGTLEREAMGSKGEESKCGVTRVGRDGLDTTTVVDNGG